MILGEYLIEKGIITKEDLDNALYEQKKKPDTTWTAGSPN